jgi:hypothetical protein
MNLDLILENIRLGHIEALLQEAATDLEVVRGQRLINESIMQLHNALMEEITYSDARVSGLDPIDSAHVATRDSYRKGVAYARSPMNISKGRALGLGLGLAGVGAGAGYAYDSLTN